jgi:integrase
MSIYRPSYRDKKTGKRRQSKVWRYHFTFNGKRVQASTRQTNKNTAKAIEAAHRTRLAKGEVGLAERRPAPKLREFAQSFADSISVRCAAKPRTIEFYANCLGRLLQFDALAEARLDQIDERLIEAYVQKRRETVSPATVNRQLATLRNLLRTAQEWKLITHVPRIRMLPGERNREFVLSRELEPMYLDMAPQPLRDVATLILDTGLRVGEGSGLGWQDIRLEPLNGAKFGFLQIRRGKTKYARRAIPLTPRVRDMLRTRAQQSTSPWVFPAERVAGPVSFDTLDEQHAEARKRLKMSKEFVIHSLRHTMLTRMGEAGADAFTIQRIAGHSSVVISQRYVHPTSGQIEQAFERFAALNGKAARSLTAAS